MSDYLTVKEISELTGKSTKTIRNNITSRADYFNDKFDDTTVIKRGREFLVLKTFAESFYTFKVTKENKKQGNTPNTETKNKLQKNKPNKGKQKETYSKLNTLLEKQLEVKDEQIKDLQNTTKELIRQNDQSQRLIGQLQQTNSTLQLGVREEVTNIKADEIKKDSWVWTIIALLIIIAAACGVYYMFYQIG